MSTAVPRYGGAVGSSIFHEPSDLLFTGRIAGNSRSTKRTGHDFRKGPLLLVPLTCTLLHLAAHLKLGQPRVHGTRYGQLLHLRSHPHPHCSASLCIAHDLLSLNSDSVSDDSGSPASRLPSQGMAHFQCQVRTRCGPAGSGTPWASVGASDGAAGHHEVGCVEAVQILQKINRNTAPRQLGSTAQVEDGLLNVGAGGDGPPFEENSPPHPSQTGILGGANWHGGPHRARLPIRVLTCQSASSIPTIGNLLSKSPSCGAASRLLVKSPPAT